MSWGHGASTWLTSLSVSPLTLKIALAQPRHHGPFTGKFLFSWKTEGDRTARSINTAALSPRLALGPGLRVPRDVEEHPAPVLSVTDAVTHVLAGYQPSCLHVSRVPSHS